LGLAIGDLGNDRWACDLRLTVTDLSSTATAGHDSVDVDGDTLCASALAVQVVEVTRKALVEHSWGRATIGRESEGAISTERESSGLASTSLERSIELEPLC
jgi:hypothetical protein